MDGSVYIGLAALTLLLFWLFRLRTKGVYKFPPGPRGWPLLGNIFDVKMGNEHIDFTRLSKEYGEVMCVNKGGANIVVLNSANAIRDAMVTEDKRDVFAGRPDSFYVKYCDFGPSVSFMTYCDVWRTQRKFLTKTLKLYDNDHHRIEEIIREQLSVTLTMIGETKGEPFDLKKIIGPSLTNILLVLIAGKRYDVNDPVLRAAIDFEEIDVGIVTGKAMDILTWLPFLRHLPFAYGKVYREYKRRQDLYFHYIFENNKKTFDPSTSRGYIDELFRLQSENKAWPKDEHIKGMVRETISAGIATTQSTVLSFFLIVLHKPEVMRTIQKEIDTFIGSDRHPMLSDRAHMPYTEAVILEVLRYVSVIPIGLCHTTTRDVKFRDYFLPKNTMVYANLWGVHHDSAVWGDPWEFRPDRFLDDDGKLLSVDSLQRRSWMPFGVGRRSCLGENFARYRVFLYITRFLQKFDFQACADEPLPSPDPRRYHTEIVIRPPSYKLRAVRRYTKVQ